MARKDYSTTAGSNTSISGINIGENCPPQNLNNAMRQLMADVADQPWADVAAASTTNIFGNDSDKINVTGTGGPITSFGTGINRTMIVKFASAGVTLTHHATSLVIPGGLNKITQAGDTAVITSDGSSNARIIAYETTKRRFRAHRNEVGQVIANATVTQVNFTTEASDVGSQFDTAAGYMTAVAPGLWSFRAQIGPGNIGASKIYAASLYHAGSIISHDRKFTDASSNFGVLKLAAEAMLAVGDVVDVRFYHEHGSAITMSGNTLYTWFSGHEV